MTSLSNFSTAHLHDIAQVAENALLPPPTIIPSVSVGAFAEQTRRIVAKAPTKLQKEQIQPLASVALRQALDLVAKLQRQIEALTLEKERLQQELEDLRKELELEKQKRKVTVKAAAVVAPQIITKTETRVVTVKEQLPPEQFYHAVFNPRPETESKAMIVDDAKRVKDTRIARMQRLSRLIHLIDATAA
jgi:hypothetical protein